MKLPKLTFHVSVKPKLWCILNCLCDVSQLEDISFPKQFRTLTWPYSRHLLSYSQGIYLLVYTGFILSIKFSCLNADAAYLWPYGQQSLQKPLQCSGSWLWATVKTVKSSCATPFTVITEWMKWSKVDRYALYIGLNPHACPFLWWKLLPVIIWCCQICTYKWWLLPESELQVQRRNKTILWNSWHCCSCM